MLPSVTVPACSNFCSAYLHTRLSLSIIVITSVEGEGGERERERERGRLASIVMCGALVGDCMLKVFHCKNFYFQSH